MAEYNKRNFALFFVDTVLFINAMTYLSVTAVITYFLSTLGASTFQISLASILVSVGTFISQPIFAKKAAGLALKLKSFTRILFIQRFFFLAFVLIIPLLVSMGSQITILTFLIFWGIFNFFVGSYTPYFMPLFSKMVDGGQIGRLRGFSGAAGNIIAMGSAYLAGAILKKTIFPYNYTIIFGLGVLFLLLDVVSFCFMQEPPENVKPKKTTYFQYIRDIPSVLRNDVNFVKLVIGCTFFVIANISLVYYTLYAIRRFDAKADEVALFMIITVVVNTLGNILFGLLADRFSHRLVMIISSICGAAAGVVILCFYSIFAVYAAFALSSLCYCGFMLSGNILIMRCVPGEQMPTYFGIYNMISLILSSLMTAASSILVDYFSFVPLFAITGLAAMGSFAVFSRLYKAD